MRAKCVGALVRIKIFFVFKNFWNLLKSCSCQNISSATVFFLRFHTLYRSLIQYESYSKLDNYVMVTSSKKNEIWTRLLMELSRVCHYYGTLEIKPLIKSVVLLSKNWCFWSKTTIASRISNKNACDTLLYGVKIFFKMNYANILCYVIISRNNYVIILTRL